MASIVIEEKDWATFEEEYSILRTEVVEVKNVFRHICRLFVLKSDLSLWNEKICEGNFEKIKVNYYEIKKRSANSSNLWVKHS